MRGSATGSALLPILTALAAVALHPGIAAAQEAEAGAGDTTFVADGDTVPFRHAEHTEVACTDCHSTEEGHGTLTVTSIRGCRSCHHSGSTAEPCTDCHERSELRAAGSYPVTSDLVMSVDTVRGRDLPFDHASHEDLECAECHSDGTELSAGSVRCAECHEEHHGAEVRCVSCHREAPEETHTLAVHATCSGSGCHEAATLPVTTRTMARSPRNVCLTCHQDQVDHRPGERCARCHLLPEGEGGGTP
ncbi:MAG: hypothetical protein Q8W44_11645 [Candidatus Palauibacterales bacterium]|nr:hypothetical protein [Candidatus Palauibacterales bacterium]